MDEDEDKKVEVATLVLVTLGRVLGFVVGLVFGLTIICLAVLKGGAK